MKTPEEMLIMYYSFVGELDSTEEADLLNVIQIAQKDAYNQALEDAVENAKIIECQHPDSKYDPRPVFTYNVDKDSILKLKK